MTHKHFQFTKRDKRDFKLPVRQMGISCRKKKKKTEQCYIVFWGGCLWSLLVLIAHYHEEL